MSHFYSGKKYRCIFAFIFLNDIYVSKKPEQNVLNFIFKELMTASATLVMLLRNDRVATKKLLLNTFKN